MNLGLPDPRMQPRKVQWCIRAIVRQGSIAIRLQVGAICLHRNLETMMQFDTQHPTLSLFFKRACTPEAWRHTALGPQLMLELTEPEQFAIGRDYRAAVAEALRAVHEECGAGSMALSGSDERRAVEAKLRQHFALAVADERVVLRSLYVARCYAEAAEAHDFDALVQALIDDGAVLPVPVAYSDPAEMVTFHPQHFFHAAAGRWLLNNGSHAAQFDALLYPDAVIRALETGEPYVPVSDLDCTLYPSATPIAFAPMALM